MQESGPVRCPTCYGEGFVPCACTMMGRGTGSSVPAVLCHFQTSDAYGSNILPCCSGLLPSRVDDDAVD
eukprot:scaffold6151_cov162-Pinguiococcus_pyrenoidosus.AAC.1